MNTGTLGGINGGRVGVEFLLDGKKGLIGRFLSDSAESGKFWQRKGGDDGGD